MDLQTIQKKISPILRKYGVQRASVFGSVSRGETTPQSDIDILVQFKEDRIPSLFTFVRIERELSEALDHKIDLVTVGSLSPYLKDAVIKEAKPIYEAR